MAPAPTRAAALEKLDAFVPLAGAEYASKRNFDFGPGKHASVSALSPYIRHRVISEVEVLEAVLSRHGPSEADKFIQEVFWRTYWKGWLEHRPSVWLGYLQQVKSALTVVEQNTNEGAAYQRAIAGNTGIEPMDSWVTELVETGYIHNHARMWFASIWIFTLKLPWVLGADFFLRHLLDGDPASNTLSWRWVAGLHTKNKAYLATPDNLATYAGTRFFAEGQPAGIDTLAAHAESIDEPALLPPRAPQLPPPTTVGPAAGLLLTEDDMHLDLPGQPVAVALWMPEADASERTSEQVRRFKAGIGKDALARAEHKWPGAVSKSVLTNLPAIADWVRREQLKQVYAAYLPVGYAAMQCARLEEALTAEGCLLQFVARDYDRSVWPHADKGFFKLKKKIPSILVSLDLATPTNAPHDNKV